MNNAMESSFDYHDVLAFLDSEDKQTLTPEEQHKKIAEPIKSSLAKRGYVREILGESGAMVELEENGQLVLVTDQLFPILTQHSPVLLYGDGEPENWSLIPPEAQHYINGVDVSVLQLGHFLCQSIDHNAKRLFGVFTPDKGSQSLPAWIAFDDLALPLPSADHLIIDTTLRVRVVFIEKNDTLKLTENVVLCPSVLTFVLKRYLMKPKKQEKQFEFKFAPKNVPIAIYALGRILENQSLSLHISPLTEEMEREVYLWVKLHGIHFTLHHRELSWDSQVELEQLALDGEILVHCGPFNPVSFHIAVQCISANDPEVALIKKHYPLNCQLQGCRIKRYINETAILLLENIDIELEDRTLYVEGLIHKGEHGWGNIVSQGSVAPRGVIGPLRVIGYDSLRCTPLFSHRQALPNPWTATSVGDLKVGEFYEAHLNSKPKRFNKVSPWGYVKPLLFPGFAIECCLPDHETYEAIIHFNPLLLVRISFIDPLARRILGELIPRETLHLGAKLEVVVYERIDDGYKVLAVNALVFAFLPDSEMITRTQIGSTLSVKVIQKENESGLTVVGQIGAKGGIANLAEGRLSEIVSGIVTAITNHYALIDLGSGVEGLLHKNELAYHCVRHPANILSLKQKITVKVISIDVQKGTVFLSLKQLQSDPWQTKMASQFPEGSTHLGLVTQLMSYGAFIELAPGLEGLLDNTEIDWNRENQNQARTQFKVGQELLVYIKKLDKVQHQMSLTRLLPALWKDGQYVASQFPEGSEHLGKLTKLAFQEAFIELAPRIEGVLRYIDIGFSTAKNIFQVGKTIKVRIKKFDFEKGLIALTICSRTKIQLQGCNGLQGRIVKLLDTGAIIKLDSGMVGSLIQNSAKALFELGQSIRVFVVKNKKTVWLTIRPFFAKPEKVLFLESDKFFSWYEQATTDKEPVVCQKLASELTTELKKVPDSVALRLYLAEVLCCLGNELQALSVLQQGIRFTPYEQELSIRAVNLARMLGKDSLARKIAQDALNGPLENKIRQGFKSFLVLDVETPKEHQTVLKIKIKTKTKTKTETKTMADEPKPESAESARDEDWRWKKEVYRSVSTG